MSATLMRSLVREGALGRSGPAAFGMQPTSRMLAARKDPGSPQLGSDQCARTPAELAAALRRSLGDGEVNRLASLYDWAGRSGREARPILQKLERMSDRPLIDGQYFNGSRATLAGSADGFVQLVQGPQSAPTVTELAVNRRAGCLFLNFLGVTAESPWPPLVAVANSPRAPKPQCSENFHDRRTTRPAFARPA